MTTSTLPATGSPSGLRLDDQLCFAAYSASRALAAAYRRGLQELGLTYTQYLVLLVLWQQPRVSVSELGRALALDSGTLSPMLKRMEAAGLVRRERGTDDERTMWIEPTEEAQALEPRAVAVQAEVVRATGLEPAEFSALRAALNQLTASLDAASR